MNINAHIKKSNNNYDSYLREREREREGEEIRDKIGTNCWFVQFCATQTSSYNTIQTQIQELEFKIQVMELSHNTNTNSNQLE